MSGITRAERERRQTERAAVVCDRPFRDAGNIVVFVGRIERAYCEPCKRRDWGAQVRLGRGDVFRCRGCLRTIADQLLCRAREYSPEEQRKAVGQLALPASEDLEVLRDLLSLADEEVEIEWLRALTPAQRDELGDWAARIHLRASDNPVRVPKRPACLPPRADIVQEFAMVSPPGGDPQNKGGR